MPDRHHPGHVEPLARHPHSATAKWAAFQKRIADEATRQEGERAARDRERRDSADYVRSQRGEPPQKG